MVFLPCDNGGEVPDVSRTCVNCTREESLNLNASALRGNRDISDFPVGPGSLLSVYQRSPQFSKSGLFPADAFLLVPVMGQIKGTCGRVGKGVHVTPLQISLTESPFRRSQILCICLKGEQAPKRELESECTRFFGDDVEHGNENWALRGHEPTETEAAEQDEEDNDEITPPPASLSR
ncbi:hypothetical protein BDN67DRAFT_1069780 [Paxillus ammoniavirescens]|nr:hypothetical protein BDN67DRAFT_1069780 [Paxillus ammoniavirescens]